MGSKNDEDITYFIFRSYSEKERPNEENRYVYYGWSKHKIVVKAFLTQRNEKKYRVIKLTAKEIEEKEDTILTSIIEGFDLYDPNFKLDYCKLKSAANKDIEVSLFSTADEMHNAEILIQRKMNKLGSLESINVPVGREKEMLEMIMNLDDYYGSALFYIGFRPIEMDILFDSVDERDSYTKLTDIEWQIHEAYDGFNEFPVESDDYIPALEGPPGINNLDDVSTKIIYSLESFISVLKEDL